MLPVSFQNKPFIKNNLIVLSLGLATLSVGIMAWRKISNIREGFGITKLIQDMKVSWIEPVPPLKSNIPITPSSVKSIESIPRNVAAKAGFPLASVSLEKKFFSLLSQPFDLNAKCNFNYLVPNEGHPENIQEHLTLSEPGLIVSVGSERSFFNLCFADPSLHTGIVIVDVNPRNSAYIHFNTLLLRISKNKEEYTQLSSIRAVRTDLSKEEAFVQKNAIKTKIEIIREKINQDKELPDEMRNYYLNNLENFAPVYFRVADNWKEHTNGGRHTKGDVFEKCRYYLDDTQFDKLQCYAKTGKIFPVVGNINDLNFLNSETIAVVDTSNIKHYIFLDIETNSTPRVIVTDQCPDITTYYSYIHKPLTPDEKNEFTRLIEILKNCEVQHNPTGISNIFYKPKSDKFNHESTAMYSRPALNNLRKLVEEHVFQVESECYYLNDLIGMAKLNKAPPSHLDALCNDERIKNYTNDLQNSWVILTSAVYLKFKNLKGWKEAFIKNMDHPHSGFHRFLLKLENEGLLAEFSDWFAPDKLSELCKNENYKEVTRHRSLNPMLAAAAGFVSEYF